MSHAELPNEDESSIACLAEETTSGNPSLPTCEKCDALINSNDSLVCRHCGWYASIGSFVEIDQDWETCSDPTQSQYVASEESESFQMPEWAWVMIGCVAVVIAESIAARYLTEAESIARTRWSLVQLMIGGIAAAICHFVAFILLIRDDSDVALLDVVAQAHSDPGHCESMNCQTRQWICHTAVSGIVAVLMSVLVIGGIPHERLWDWGFANQ